MVFNSKGAKRIESRLPYGVYVWEMPDGKWVGDDEGNYALVFAMRGDREKIRSLSNLVRSCSREAHDLGKPKFLPGRRPVTDEEYEEQVRRQKFGLVPDPLDIDAAGRNDV